MTEYPKDIAKRNKAMNWGCSCHGMTFCPGLKFTGYEDDVPTFEYKTEADRLATEKAIKDRFNRSGND